MKHIFGKKGQSGFSLVELMIVVGIIGVLATLALPRFKQFQAKAKMAEAQNVLQHVYTLQQSYALDNTVYVAFGPLGAGTGAPTGGNVCVNGGATTLGLQIEPCLAAGPTPRFSYSGVTYTTNTEFTASAITGAAANNRICPGNPGFFISLTQANVSRWGAGGVPGQIAGTQGATPQIGNVCPN